MKALRGLRKISWKVDNFNHFNHKLSVPVDRISNFQLTNQPTMGYWLVKSDPEEYGWKELVRDQSTVWTGVRNFKARNNLKSMKRGDKVLFYHSQTDKAVVGIAKVAKEHHPDPTAAKGEPWVAVDLAPDKVLKNPVTLQQIKANNNLSHVYLIRQPRLSVMPLGKEDYLMIVKMGE